MADVVMADDGVVFDGRTGESSPLGGAEAAFVSLAEALAERGHRVRAFTNCAASFTHKGVAWAPVSQAMPDTADLYIANRGDRLIGRVPNACTHVFWVHNPGAYLKKLRYVRALWRWRPVVVAIGDYAGRTVPRWLPKRALVVIPYGLADAFRHATERPAPPPVAIFTSNPLRGLDWLLDIWIDLIQPMVPKAELRIYAGPAVYGAAGAKHAEAMARVLDRAAALADQGVRRLAPLPRAALVEALQQARVMLYRGDANETYCAAVAEAQALGVPAVVTPLGSLPERVKDGVTGVIARDDAAFAAAAVRLLTDDDEWRRMHTAALAQQRGLSWRDVAIRFEDLMQ
ncbi:MAG: glycosyltransferase family 4 protein [Alphaproteobacteria bacterium]|nr:glycosyltransferase family 4 protein [Alphaproteobacteria bacterium]